jgi:glycosidase
MPINTQCIPAYPADADFSNAIAGYVTGVGAPTNAYHWTPNMNFSIPEQRTNYQESSLDDVNTEDPYMRAKMTAAFRYWISEVGIDGFRVDTVRDVPKDFWKIFCYSTDPDTLGMIPHAQQLGKDNFIVFGEVHTLGEGSPAEQAALSAALYQGRRRRSHHGLRGPLSPL